MSKDSLRRVSHDMHDRCLPIFAKHQA